MTPVELLESCKRALWQGSDFLPLVLRRARRSDSYRVRALGQMCDILCVNSDGELVVKVSATKTIKWLEKQMLLAERSTTTPQE